jgi:Ca-activated chloride channel homolog
MTAMAKTSCRLAVATVGLLGITLFGQEPRQAPAERPPERVQDSPPVEAGGNARFRSGIELVNVTATVFDANGRYVPNLTKDDFTVYEDGHPQAITQFSADRVPVSLGIALDTSASMQGDKMAEAERALDRFLYDLLDPHDEIFLYRFSNSPVLLQSWTTDRALLARALGHISPSGGTALYDAVIEAIPLTREGRNAKKALLIISDGNDTSSRADLREARQRVTESETLVYAVGIDGEGEPTIRISPQPPRAPIPTPVPFPFPPGNGGRGRWPGAAPPRFAQGWPLPPSNDRVNAAALRSMTDDSGGRTEIVRNAPDLGPATTSIADELSRQYYLGYAPSGKKDGRWHSIRVDVRNRNYRVRARRGYVAS